MDYGSLGAADCSISRIGFGCAPMGGYDYGRVNDNDSIAAVHRALDLGINFFDTADVYGLGHSEEILARALAERRQDMIIATKFGVAFDGSGKTWRDTSPSRVRQALEGSLRRMRLETVPLFQLHWPDEKTPLADTMAEMVRCQEEGKIRFIGCCNLTVPEVAEMQRVGRVESIQLPFSLLERRHAPTFVSCAEIFQMSGLAYSSLAHGALSGRTPDPSRFTESDLRSRSADTWQRVLSAAESFTPHLEAIGQRLGRTPGQIAVRWVLDQGGVTGAIVGAKKPWQIEEISGAAGWQLEMDVMRSLEAPS
jgi:aryl-alcohol dehydrogenase-like predicted oxidoreductase